LIYLKVISIRDVSSTYHVPLLLREQGVFDFLKKRLHLDSIYITPAQREKGESLLKEWINLTEEYAIIDLYHNIFVDNPNYF
jgi:CTP synthase